MAGYPSTETSNAFSHNQTTYTVDHDSNYYTVQAWIF